MSWNAIDLSKIGERPQTRPTIGGIVYPGKRHLFSGPPESAKTLAAYALALEEIRRGRFVLVMDLEMGQWDARDRLRDLGATDQELGDLLLYVEPETGPNEDTLQGSCGSTTSSSSRRASRSSTLQPARSRSPTSTTTSAATPNCGPTYGCGHSGKPL